MSDVASTAESTLHVARSSWSSQLYSVLRSQKKLDELTSTCIGSYDPWFSSLAVMAHYEASWWIQTNISEYKATNTFVLPNLSKRSLLSWKEWQQYWEELKERVLPAVLEHQASILLLYCFKELISVLASSTGGKIMVRRLTQHPYYRARAITTKSYSSGGGIIGRGVVGGGDNSPDRLTAGMEMIAVSFWANLLFFVSKFYVGRLRALYEMKRTRDTQQRHRGDVVNERSSLTLFWNTSWRSLHKSSRRYFYSSIGGGLGSIVWPGWGTLFGIAAADTWVESQPDCSDVPPDPFTLLDQLPGSTPRASGMSNNGNNNNINAGSSSENEMEWAKRSSLSSSIQDELLCGCCQIVTFSSNAHSRKRAPVSSRVCDHTICKSCVEQCQLALMERTSSYEEWIKCPLCNAQNAFNCHNHLVNRSLCSAIAMLESQAGQK